LPKTFAIDYIVEDENRIKFGIKINKRAELAATINSSSEEEPFKKVQPDTGMNRSYTDAE